MKKKVEYNPNASDLFEAGKKLMEKKEWESAIKQFDLAIQQDPDNADFYYNKGLAYSRSKQYDLAISSYNTAISHKPNCSKFYNSRGIARKLNGDPLSAIDDYTQAIKLREPPCTNFYFNRACAYRAAGELNSALQDIRTAIHRKKTDPDFYNERGNIYKAQGKLDLAIGDYTKAIDMATDSEKGEFYDNRAQAYEAKGEKAFALSDAKRARFFHIKSARVFYNFGLCNLKDNNVDLALSHFNQAIQLDPEQADFYYCRAKIYHGKSLMDLAIADYTKAIQLEKNNTIHYVYYYDRALAYKALGQLDNASTDLKKAMELNPRYINVYNVLGKIYELQGHFDKALEIYNKGIECNPRSPTLYNLRGVFHYNKASAHEAYQEAIDDFTSVIYLSSKTMSANYFNRGLTLNRQANLDLKASNSILEQAIAAQEDNIETARSLKQKSDLLFIKKEQERMQGRMDYTKAMELDIKVLEQFRVPLQKDIIDDLVGQMDELPALKASPEKLQFLYNLSQKIEPQGGNTTKLKTLSSRKLEKKPVRKKDSLRVVPPTPTPTTITAPTTVTMDYSYLHLEQREQEIKADAARKRLAGNNYTKIHERQNDKKEPVKTDNKKSLLQSSGEWLRTHLNPYGLFFKKQEVAVKPTPKAEEPIKTVTFISDENAIAAVMQQLSKAPSTPKEEPSKLGFFSRFIGRGKETASKKTAGMAI